MSITIDGVVYSTPILKLNRSFAFLDKFAERTADGSLQRELIGTYYNYDLTFGMSANGVSAYAALYLKVSEPAEFHTVSIPGENGGASWEAYIGPGKDEIARLQKDGVNYYRGLTFPIIARSPARTP